MPMCGKSLANRDKTLIKLLLRRYTTEDHMTVLYIFT